MHMSSFEKSYTDYKKLIDDELKEFISSSKDGQESGKLSRSLNDTVKYVISMGGKRIRPVLLLLSCQAFGGEFKTALPAAVAIEILHNFTLVHDDIMDNADTRRGHTTVHKKWDVNSAILAGDQLIALAYNSLLKTNTPGITEITKCFTEGVLQVCEGQALDKEFETKESVSIDDYLLMIKKKTAELVKSAVIIGAITANAGLED